MLCNSLSSMPHRTRHPLHYMTHCLMLQTYCRSDPWHKSDSANTRLSSRQNMRAQMRNKHEPTNRRSPATCRLYRTHKLAWAHPHRNTISPASRCIKITYTANDIKSTGTLITSYIIYRSWRHCAVHLNGVTHVETNSQFMAWDQNALHQYA